MGTDADGHSSVPLGLGSFNENNVSRPSGAVPESRVLSPSEMFAIGDALILPDLARRVDGQTYKLSGFDRLPWEDEWKSEIKTDRHPGGNNNVFCDGHIEYIKRTKHFQMNDQSRKRWNNDNKPHRETWDD